MADAAAADAVTVFVGEAAGVVARAGEEELGGTGFEGGLAGEEVAGLEGRGGGVGEGGEDQEGEEAEGLEHSGGWVGM